MNLSTKSIEERAKLTAHFPLALVGPANAGKTYALESMSAEDKARTVILNFDTKPLGTGASDEFYSVYAISATQDTLKSRVKALSDQARQFKADGKPIPEHIKDFGKHLSNIQKHSFFIDDNEAIDKIVSEILELTFNPDVDRIVMDTATAMIDFCESWSQANFSGRDCWSQYGNAVKRILQALKEATIFGMKYTYVFSHHDNIPAAQYDITPKEIVKVKGSIMSGNFEQHFSTIVFTHQNVDKQRIFECSNHNMLDTSRTKSVINEFKFVRTSLDDLEQVFAGNLSVIEAQANDTTTD
jgi:hypothetical protein